MTFKILKEAESGEEVQLNVELFPVPEALDETLKSLRFEAYHKKIIFKKEIDPKLDKISADKKKFKRILWILISKAFQFSEPQGRTITISGQKTNDMALFSVSVACPGIREDDFDKVFNSFYLADSWDYLLGSGIWHKIIKQFVEQQGGEIWVKIDNGKSPTFTFTLPLKAYANGAK